ATSGLRALSHRRGPAGHPVGESGRLLDRDRDIVRGVSRSGVRDASPGHRAQGCGHVRRVRRRALARRRPKRRGVFRESVGVSASRPPTRSSGGLAPRPPDREKVVGVLVGRENTFPGPFTETVNRKGESRGVRAEMAVLGGAREVESPRYAVIVDRISHEVPYYRAHLKGAAVLGTVVVNDPFWWEADEKFFECVLARELGVAVPK